MVLGSSSKTMISSTQKTAAARAMVPLRRVLCSKVLVLWQVSKVVDIHRKGFWVQLSGING